MPPSRELPLPPHFDPGRVGEVWRVDYERRAADAAAWARMHAIPPASSDRPRICLIAVDLQNTFCIPGFELFVAGRSGTGAVDDNRRLCAFIYRHLHRITQICPTLDTHGAMQIFHAVFLVDAEGHHPPPYTQVSAEDIRAGRWRFNTTLAEGLGYGADYVQRHLAHYTRNLEAGGKYALTVWPYHAMLGGIGHALVPAVEEAVFFHGLARSSPPAFQVKGDHPLTEHYSVFGPEVRSDPEGAPLAPTRSTLLDRLRDFDAVLIAGQAKSHCVAWTVADLLGDLQAQDPGLARKVYLLEDCCSPVVVPGALDTSEAADAAFRRFAEAGMHLVRSTEPMEGWLALG